MGRRTLFLILWWAWAGCGCDDAAPQAPGCDALGAQLAVGEQVVDEAACVVCVCEASGLPTCTPWPECPDRGRPPPRADAALRPDGAPQPAPDGGPLDASLDAEADARLVPSEDPDGDGQPTDVERVAGTDPLDPDSFSPRFARVPSGGQVQLDTALTPRFRSVDLAFVVDSTSSMQEVIDGLVDQLAALALRLAERVDDARYGLGVFRDYAAMAGPSNYPFLLSVPLNHDAGRTAAGLRAVRALGGGDAQESTYEALQQALTGAGYDEGCDGEFDLNADVRPYVAAPRDAFGGAVMGAAMGDAGRLGKGGVGFDPGALPIIILATDAPFRDPTQEPAPGGCPFDATEATVVAAARGLGAKIITLYTQPAAAVIPPEFTALAVATDSVLPGPDGIDAPLVFGVQDPLGLADEVFHAVTELLGAVRFEAAWIDGEARPPAVAVRPVPADLGPLEADDFGSPRPVSVVLEATDGGRRIVSLELTLLAGAGVVLDRQQWWVLVE